MDGAWIAFEKETGKILGFVFTEEEANARKKKDSNLTFTHYSFRVVNGDYVMIPYLKLN